MLPGDFDVSSFTAACRCSGGTNDGAPCTGSGIGRLTCNDTCETNPGTCPQPCQVVLADEFVGRLFLVSDDDDCDAGGGSKLTLGLRLKRADGQEFTVPARTMDLCDVNPACNEPYQSFLCALEDGIGGNPYPGGTESLRANEALFADYGFGASRGFGGSFEAMPLLQALAEQLTTLDGPFPNALGMPVLSRAVPVAADDHRSDSAPTTQVWCVRGGWLNRNVFSQVVPAPMAAAATSTSPGAVAVDDLGTCLSVFPDFPGAGVPAIDDENCDDGSVCTDDARFETGECLNIPVLCDLNPCTLDSCDPIAGCAATLPDVCDDGDPCTSEFCSRYLRQYECSRTDACDDGNACTVDTCNEVEGCLNSPGCEDGEPCTIGSCNEFGSCDYVLSCDDFDACTTDTCDENEGCLHHLAPIGRCDDGDACTSDDCDGAGGCVYTTNECDDGDACTIDECDSIQGCLYTASPPAGCDDDDPCTVEHCDGEGGCVTELNHYICIDNDSCTIDICNPDGPLCGCTHQLAPPDGCDDGNPCTNDYCDGEGGCYREDVFCLDDNPCTLDTCNSETGECAFTPGTGSDGCTTTTTTTTVSDSTTTTVTNSTVSTTTTTVDEPLQCAQPVSSGPTPVSSDCLYILQAAVGLVSCTPECTCAPTGTLPAKATDALLCLNVAVGIDRPINCPCE